MNELSALLSIFMAFLTIIGTLGGFLIFIFKFGSTFTKLINGIERLNEHFSRLESKNNATDEKVEQLDSRVDDIDRRVVVLETKESSKNESQ